MRNKTTLIFFLIVIIGTIVTLILSESVDEEVVHEPIRREISGFGNSDVQNDNGVARSDREVGSRQRKAILPTDPQIESLVNFIRDFEKERSNLTTESVSDPDADDHSIFIFTLRAATPMEVEELASKIQDLGSVFRENNGSKQLWSDYLREKYYLDYIGNQISYTIAFRDRNNSVRMIVDVIDPLTNVKKRLPESFTFARKTVDGKRWRFDHLLKFDTIEEGD